VKKMRLFETNAEASILTWNKRKDYAFAFITTGLLIGSLAVLALLIYDLMSQGISRMSLQFLTSFPSRFAERAGILAAWVGSLATILVTAVMAIPMGMAAAIYLEEYAAKTKFSSFIELCISNLAGVPSILFGLLALGLFVQRFHMGNSILTAGCTLALLILPIVIVATREALRSVPSSLREAAYALGATKWEVIRDHLIPSAASGILTGIIISLSRALGESAPLVTIGALTFIAFLPTAPIQPDFPFLSFKWLFDPFTVMPVQVFNWVSRPQEEFHANAAAAAVVLLVLTLSLNGVAIGLRIYLRRKSKW